MLFGMLQYADDPGGLGDAFGLVARRARRRARLPPRGAHPRRRACAADARAQLAERRRLGRRSRHHRVLAAGLVFTLLPGHVAEMSDTLHALPFVCLGVVLGYAVLRTGALCPLRSCTRS